MEAWVKELRINLGQDVPIIVVGNKEDLEANRQIKKATAEEYAKKLGMDHFSASAKTGKNVSEIFQQITSSK
jgi:GTPase SAR1 family protein